MKAQDQDKTPVESGPTDAVRRWLSTIGKKGAKKGRATPPRNPDGSPGSWGTPDTRH